MSQEDLQKFLEAVRQDSSLQERLQSAADAEAVVAIAKTASFTLDAEEARKVIATVPTELSDSDLEDVAGGALGGHSGKNLPAGVSQACGDVNTVQICVP